MPLTLGDGIEIPDDEITYTASRSGGPGGQHVNKTSSRVTLRFDVAHSPSLPSDVRERLIAALGRRVAGDGSVRVVSQASRSQHANRVTARARLEALLRHALVVKTPRVPTTATPGAQRRRVEGKARRSAVKRDRAFRGEDE